MTVLRREDVQSKRASWDRGPYRIAHSPILAIVPLILRRLRGPSLSRPHHALPDASRARVSLLHPGRDRLERGPQKSGELPCDRDGDLRGGFVFGRQFAEAPTQPLL